MRNIFLSICLAALTPLSVVANENPNSSLHVQVTQNKHLDAIDLILEDHKQITKTIEKLEKNLGSDLSKCRAIFSDLKALLEKHETMEQTIWYSELEKHQALKNIIVKRKKEEQTASNELKEIDSLKEDKEWKMKVQKLIKDVKNHAKAEENQLFPKVKKILNKSELDEIGKKMEDYKNHQKN